MQLASIVFTDGASIPERYGQDFANVNPPLTVTDVPPGTVSLALTMDDPDVPAAAGVPVWDYWVVYNIPPHIVDIPEHWQAVGTRGKGTRGYLDYSGPRPPDGEHRYFFRVYALDCMLDLAEGATKDEVLEHITGHVLAQAELMGRFAPRTL